MSACPDDGRPLRPEGETRACTLCRGALYDGDFFARRFPRAVDALAVETRESSGGYARIRPCPSCQAPMVPQRIDVMEAWVEHCASCAHYWVDVLDVKVLERFGQRHAVKRAVATMSKAEREEMARDLAGELRVDSGPETHEVALAAVGIPTLSRTEGDKRPLMTWLLGAVLLLVHVLALTDPTLLERYVHRSDAPALDTAVAANFLHFGWLHLLGNVAFLFTFASGVERKVPRLFVPLVFVLFGALSLQVEAELAERTLQIAGASGGVAALMGACIVLQPRSRVNLALAGAVLPVPIWGYGIFELCWQMLMAAAGVPGVAWWAHVAGLVSGVVFGVVARVVFREEA